MDSCNHAEFTDPRGKGSCRKCGRWMPSPFPAEVVDEFFDRLREGLDGAGEEDPGPTFEWFKSTALRGSVRCVGWQSVPKTDTTTARLGVRLLTLPFSVGILS